MCRAKSEGGRRCPNREKWCVNKESHPTFHTGDESQEREMHRPEHLCSMDPTAVRTRRSRARKKAAEVDAMRRIHGLAEGQALGPVLRSQLWEHRRSGAGLSLLTMADSFSALAEDRGVSVAEVAAEHQATKVIPYRQQAGERLLDLIGTEGRPEWIDPEYLIGALAHENGELAPAYCWTVRNPEDESEWHLVTSYDGSEPMAWPATDASLMEAASVALDRLHAAQDTDEYHEYLAAQGDLSGAHNPFTQDMSDGDFLANHDGMHLV